MSKSTDSSDIVPTPKQETTVPSSVRYTEETVISVFYWTPSLLSFRTSRNPNFRFTPGHYARLGLDCCEGKVVWRPFSLVSGQDDDYLEFLAILVPNGEFSEPLSNIRVGDIIQVDKASYGFMTMDGFAPGKDLWLLATGTGIGPYLSILRDATTWNAFENIVLVHSVRYANELVYQDDIKAIIQAHSVDKFSIRLRYIQVVTRELQLNALSARIPQLIEDGQLELTAGLPLALNRSRIMACGNPEMIREVRALLTAKGFQTNRRASPGQLAFENYWLIKP
jgi:ferredoxin--NADP+ reductase